MSEVPESRGLFCSLKRLLATSLEIVRARAELLSVEFEEEVERLAQLFFYAAIALFFSGLAVILISIMIIVAFWNENRLLALGILATLFSCIGIFTGMSFLAKMKARSRLFSQSIAELSKDLSELE